MSQYETIINGGLYFDGTKHPASIKNIGIKDGKIAKVTDSAIDAKGCDNVIDATGKWITPGFIDTHTHYDAEMLISPSLYPNLFAMVLPPC